jgi:CRP/FNR family cyclic AMP-dependent transcriptional regulator
VSSVSRCTSALCHILREDGELAHTIPPAERDRATLECTAPTMRILSGAWSGDVDHDLVDGIGLLVLEGLLIRRVTVDGRCGAELLGDGDLLRPWQGEHANTRLPRTSAWRVLEPTRFALLDRAAAGRLARYPALTGSLVGRALERSRNLAISMAIVHHARVELRLRMLFWHLAHRWGMVSRDGVIIALGLSRTVIADLIAAQRPSVSITLSDLDRQGLVRQTRDGWLVRDDPPGELLELRGSAPANRSRSAPGDS